MKKNTVLTAAFSSWIFFCIYALAGDLEGERKYSIPYTAPERHENLYENLKKMSNDKAEEFINLSKSVAFNSGYPLVGSNLDKYLYKENTYILEISTWENEQYVHIHILPNVSISYISDNGSINGFGETSHNLVVIFSKKENKIISILKGS